MQRPAPPGEQTKRVLRERTRVCVRPASKAWPIRLGQYLTRGCEPWRPWHSPARSKHKQQRGGTAAAGRRPARPASPAALPRGSAAANMQHHCLRVLCQSVDLLTHSLHSVPGTQHAAVGGRCGRLQPAAPASAVLAWSGFGGQGVAPGRAAPEDADGMELKACTLVGGVDGPCAAWGVRRGEVSPPGVICWGSPCCSATTLARRSSRRAAGSSRCVIDASR